MRKIRLIGTVALLALLAVAAGSAWAGKGGNKPGGGGGGTDPGIADADVALLFQDQNDGALWVADLAGNAEETLYLPGDKQKGGGYTWGMQEPAFGPAGTTKIVYCARTAGQGIYVADDFTGRNARLVVETARRVTYPSWSNGATPNGEEMIAFIESDADGNNQIFVTTLDGDVTKLTSFLPVDLRNLSWNPVTNDQLLFQLAQRIFTIDVASDANGDLYLAAMNDPLRGRSYELAADGSFVYDEDGNVKYVQAEPDHTVGTALEGLYWTGPHFSLDGLTIGFSALTGTERESEAWTLARDPDTGAVTLTNLIDGARDRDTPLAGILPDGRVLLSWGGGPRWELWVIDADGTDTQQLVAHNRASIVAVAVRR